MSAIEFGSGFIQIPLTWDTFRDVSVAKALPIQFITTPTTYEVFSIDTILVYRTTIFTGTVPDVADVDQDTNDGFKSDFEDNFKDDANKPLSYRSSLGDVAAASAKGLGGFTPDPDNNPYQPFSDERVSLYVDGEGSLVTRGGVLTDEGSFRDEFSGNSLETTLSGTIQFVSNSIEFSGVNTDFTTNLNRDDYIRLVGGDVNSWRHVVRVPDDLSGEIDTPYTGSVLSGSYQKTKWLARSGSNGAQVVTSSYLKLNVSTSNGSYSNISRDGDFPPIYCRIVAKLNTRSNNQFAFLGFQDDITNAQSQAIVYFDGTDNTKIKFRTSPTSDPTELQESIITLPVGFDTTDYLEYQIHVTPSNASLAVNDIFLARHRDHLPGIYEPSQLVAGIKNTGTTTTGSLCIDTFLFSNQDQIEIVNNFQDPIPIIVKEDLHTVTSTLTTSTTTADQVILSYTVPTGKTFHIVGYSIAANGTANALPIKIGKNDVSTEPAAPGTLDSNIFRVFNWMVSSVGSNTEVDYGSNPRKFASAGDIFKVTVTPSGLLSTTWRVSVDFVLR